MSEINKLVFIFPYHEVGGVSLLFLRLSEYLAKNSAREIYVVDYKDGYIAKNVKCSSIKLIEYTTDADVALPLSSILIFQSMTPWSLFPSLTYDKSHKFIFWNCHPYNLIPILPGIRNFLFNHEILHDLVNHTILYGFKKRVKRFLSLLIEKNAIVFMDNANVAVTSKRLHVELQNVNYLPIPVNPPDMSTFVKNAKHLSKIHMAWIGRIVDFKYYILLRTIERASAAQKQLNIPIEITIVGDGDYKDQLTHETKAFANIKIFFIDHLPPAEIDTFLTNEVDVLIGMGTSALEGAKLKIPTILLDFSYSPVHRNYQFKWLQNESGYNLGAPIKQQHLAVDDGSLSRLLSSIINNKQAIGNEAYCYYEKNHSLNVVAPQLLHYIDNSDCSYEDILSRSILGRGFIYSFFSKLRGLVNK